MDDNRTPPRRVWPPMHAAARSLCYVRSAGALADEAPSVVFDWAGSRVGATSSWRWSRSGRREYLARLVEVRQRIGWRRDAGKVAAARRDWENLSTVEPAWARQWAAHPDFLPRERRIADQAADLAAVVDEAAAVEYDHHYGYNPYDDPYDDPYGAATHDPPPPPRLADVHLSITAPRPGPRAGTAPAAA